MVIQCKRAATQRRVLEQEPFSIQGGSEMSNGQTEIEIPKTEPN